MKRVTEEGVAGSSRDMDEGRMKASWRLLAGRKTKGWPEEEGTEEVMTEKQEGGRDEWGTPSEAEGGCVWRLRELSQGRQGEGWEAAADRLGDDVGHVEAGTTEGNCVKARDKEVEAGDRGSPGGKRSAWRRCIHTGRLQDTAEGRS